MKEETVDWKNEDGNDSKEKEEERQQLTAFKKAQNQQTEIVLLRNKNCKYL